MITTALLVLAFYALSLIFAVFPLSSGFSSDVISSFATIGGYTAIVDALVNMATLASAVALVFTFELLIFSYKLIKSMMGHVPFVGGK